MKCLNRREFARSAAAGIALAGCGRRRLPMRDSLVSILRSPAYGPNLYDDLRRLLATHRLDVRGKRVLLKPNLVEFEPNRPINTHPMLVHAALEAFRALGADVRIGEGPGHRRNTLDLAAAAGYFKVIPRFDEIFTDLNLDDVAGLEIPHGNSRLESVYVAKTARACDLLVSMPKMKTHHWVGATLSMKNLFGVVSGGVYGWPKNILHWAGIPECVADLYSIFPRTFAIVDGVVGMEGNGPIEGSAKPVGAVVAGRDLPAVDATCCQIMGIDPRRIEYLRLATSDIDALVGAIHQAGESISTVRAAFDLLPEWRAIRLT